MTMRTVICKRCGTDFEIPNTAHAKYCQHCRPLVKLDYYRNYNRDEASNRQVTIKRPELMPGSNEWLDAHTWVMKFSMTEDFTIGSRFCKADVENTTALGHFPIGTEFVNSRSGDRYKVVKNNGRNRYAKKTVLRKMEVT